MRGIKLIVPPSAATVEIDVFEDKYHFKYQVTYCDLPEDFDISTMPIVRMERLGEVDL